MSYKLVNNYLIDDVIDIRLAIFLCIVLFILRLIIKAMKKQRKKSFYINSGIKAVDMMKGIEFECFLSAHFEKMGYKVTLTKTTNDYGADLVLAKNSDIIAVQAKRYNSKVGIKAVQEIVASISYYKATKGIVVTNNYFTKNAIDLAKANRIELWNRNKLISVMEKNGCKKLADNIVERTKELKICPICGGKLTLRNGTYGTFYGCSNYPKCEFTRKYN